MPGRRLYAVVLVLAGLAAGCSGDDGSPTAGSDAASTPSPTTIATAPQAGFDISRVELDPVPEGGGVPQSGAEALPAGYVEAEYLLSGTAATYRGEPNEPATPTGRESDYTTRIIVRTPSDPAAFSGRVVVEPFNTSGGADRDVIWLQADQMLVEAGDAWVGVTVRTNSGILMQDFDAARYADVDVPTNDVAWDILRQVGGLLKEGGEQSPLGDGLAEHVYLVGYSQSGLDTATFLGAIGGITLMDDGSPVYDGYLPAARSASLTPLRSGTAFVPTFVYEPMGSAAVPVVDLESQSDVQGFDAPALPGVRYTSPGGAEVRKDDSDDPDDLYRLYEVAGMPHGSGGGTGCEGPPSNFPNLYFVRAALEQLFAWAETGEPAPEAERLELSGQDGVVWTAAVDDLGNAVGGVRSPFVDVPLVRYVAQADPGALCKLRGNEFPLDTATLAGLYDSPEDYLEQFTADLEETIDAGFLRAADRDELIDLATDSAEQAFT